MLASDPESGITFILKPGSGGQSPVLGVDEERATQSAREACFYQVADTWGLGRFLPKTELITMDGKQVAAMKFLPHNFKSLDERVKEDQFMVYHLLDKYRYEGILHKWAILDWILGNGDRHGQNELIDKPCTKIYLIDHGSAFAGKDFNPGHDLNAWIPYYLRAWFRNDRWNRLTPQEKMLRMPIGNAETENLVKDWVFRTLNPDTLSAILRRYGINPEPELERLKRVQQVIQIDGLKGINKLWTS
jgi:hypothetical protein